MNLVTVAIAFIFLAAVTPSQQKLPDIAAAQGRSVQNSVFLEYEPATMRRLVEESDVVVQAVVRDVTPRLNGDQVFVVTDCALDPVRFFKQHVPVAFAPQAGQQTTSLIVRHPGGTVADGAYQLSTVANEFKTKDEFRVGEEMILFLVLNKEERVFYLTFGPFGGFRIKYGVVEALSPEAAQERHDTRRSVAEFLSELDHTLALAR